VDLVHQNERLETMDQVKSDFITIASHELRTPLTQVKGYADILSAMNEDNDLTQDQTREIVGHINRATMRLESLISAMLDASQIDVEGMQLIFMETRIDTIVRLAMEPLNQAIRERRISFTTQNLETLPVIQADFKRLVQTFTNLLGNAIKYTPDHGSVLVEGSVIPSANGDDDYIEVVIADTGIGIDAKYHELIFEKFFRIGDPQLHSTGSTKFKGAGPGLGLPIARGVIAAHGGNIWVESDGEDEKRLPGSRFHLTLPVCSEAAKKQIETLKLKERPSWLIG
jgi:signal transduction histidine kinase